MSLDVACFRKLEVSGEKNTFSSCVPVKLLEVLLCLKSCQQTMRKVAPRVELCHWQLEKSCKVHHGSGVLLQQPMIASTRDPFVVR